jgi:hypothetical protein
MTMPWKLAALNFGRGTKGLIGALSVLLLSALIAAPSAMADKLLRLDEETRGSVADIAIAPVSALFSNVDFLRPSNRVVAALRDGQNKLRLIVWDTSDNVLRERDNKATEGTIKTVSIASVAQNRVVTAVRDSDDMLRVIVWDIASNGQITRRGTGTSVKILDVDVSGAADFGPNPSSQRFFTAARDRSGNLHVADWSVRTNGDIDGPPRTAVFGPVSSSDAASGFIGFYSHVLALRDSQEELRLIRFQNESTGLIQRGATITAGKVSLVKTSGYDFSGHLYTATVSPGPTGVLTGILCTHRLLVGAGQLKIIRWDTSHDGTFLHRAFNRKGDTSVSGHESVATAIDIKPITFSFGSLRAIAVSAHSGFGTFCNSGNHGKRQLHVNAWDEDLKKTAQATMDGDFTDVEIAPIRPGDGFSRFVTALRGSGGNLKLVLWALDD